MRGYAASFLFLRVPYTPYYETNTQKEEIIMARFNAMEVEWEEVEVVDRKGLFSCLRIDRESVPKGWYMYEVRHDDFGHGDPVEIAYGILVNHWGTLLVKEPFDLEPYILTGDTFLDINPDEDWNYLGGFVKFKELIES